MDGLFSQLDNVIRKIIYWFIRYPFKVSINFNMKLKDAYHKHGEIQVTFCPEELRPRAENDLVISLWRHRRLYKSGFKIAVKVHTAVSLCNFTV